MLIDDCRLRHWLSQGESLNAHYWGLALSRIVRLLIGHGLEPPRRRRLAVICDAVKIFRSCSASLASGPATERLAQPVLGAHVQPHVGLVRLFAADANLGNEFRR
jgi:hypothetical protein